MPANRETLYRLIGDDRPRAEDFLSHRESPRARPVPRTAPFVLLVGVSMFSSLERALEIGRRRPAFVAELVLREGRGLSIAQTGQAGHHTVWGAPEELRDCVVRVERAP